MTDKLITIAENSVELHNRCVENHYTAVVTGDGTDTLTFHIPFEPDALLVACTDPVVQVQDYIVCFFNADFRSLGYLCAVSQVSAGGVYNNLAMTNQSVFNRYSRQEDGTVVLQNIVSKGNTCVFGQGMDYGISAVKFSEGSDKERFTALVGRLTGSGTLKVWGEKVHNAFTDEEWAALTATKPDWVFQEV